MEQLNKIELRGSIGSIRLQTYNDNPVAHFTLATDYVYKDKDGVPVIETTWHNVTAWEGRDIQKLDELEKGSKVYVLGRVRNQRFTGSDGIDRTSNEVVARRVVKLDQEQPLSREMI